MTPIAGRVHTGWLPSAGGGGQSSGGPYIFTLTGPTLLTALTGVAPPVVNPLQWRLISRSSGNLLMAAKNVATSNVANIRLISITNVTNGFAYSGPLTLPAVIPGGNSLTPNSDATFNLAFTNSGVTTGPFSFTMTVDANGVSQYQVTINVP